MRNEGWGQEISKACFAEAASVFELQAQRLEAPSCAKRFRSNLAHVMIGLDNKQRAQRKGASTATLRCGESLGFWPQEVSAVQQQNFVYLLG
eukprot:748799-Hanusia_phi.AAC.3